MIVINKIFGKLKVKELGGPGCVHNWKFSRKIVEQSKVPVFLAGGLTSENVRQAIDQVQPFGVDLCSGFSLFQHHLGLKRNYLHFASYHITIVI